METGSIMVTPFPGAIKTKAGSATVLFFGIEPAILDLATGQVGEQEGEVGELEGAVG